MYGVFMIIKETVSSILCSDCNFWMHLKHLRIEKLRKILVEIKRTYDSCRNRTPLFLVVDAPVSALNA